MLALLRLPFDPFAGRFEFLDEARLLLVSTGTLLDHFRAPHRRGGPREARVLARLAVAVDGRASPPADRPGFTATRSRAYWRRIPMLVGIRPVSVGDGGGRG